MSNEEYLKARDPYAVELTYLSGSGTAGTGTGGGSTTEFKEPEIIQVVQKILETEKELKKVAALLQEVILRLEKLEDLKHKVTDIYVQGMLMNSRISQLEAKTYE